jgi:hypothetical protein
MKIKAIIVLIMLMSTVKVGAQTVDPATQAQLIELNATQKTALGKDFEQLGIYGKMLELQKSVKEAMENFGWAQKLASMKRLKGLMEKMVCQTTEMEFYLGLSDNLGCAIGIDYEVAILNLEAGLDFVSLAVGTAVVAMTSGERIKTLDDAISRVEKGLALIQKFNTQQEWGFQKLLNRSWGDSQLGSTFSITRG